jgi:hypothetical protein
MRVIGALLDEAREAIFCGCTSFGQSLRRSPSQPDPAGALQPGSDRLIDKPARGMEADCFPFCVALAISYICSGRSAVMVSVLPAPHMAILMMIGARIFADGTSAMVTKSNRPQFRKDYGRGA